MPEKQVVQRAERDKEEGKSPSTQAGEFVREEMHHVREGKHGARSPQQAIAIGLSKARRAGVDLPPPKKGRTSERTRAQAARDTRKGKKSSGRKPSRTRSRATSKALKREGRSAASPAALSRHARSTARMRGSQLRHRSARKAARTRAGTQNRGAGRRGASKRLRWQWFARRGYKVATQKKTKDAKSAVEKSRARKSRKSSSPLKGVHLRQTHNGALPPNQNQQKYPDEVYGDTEIPFREWAAGGCSSLKDGHMNQENTTARVRKRAYELFLERGGAPGGALRDWLKAEHEIWEQERGHHRGPARILDKSHHGKLTDGDGCDFENPT
jgi:Protein of unknown function (DUF2934)/Family of unknown function (DUF6496)